MVYYAGIPGILCSKVRAVVGEVSGDAWLTAFPPLTNMTAQVICWVVSFETNEFVRLNLCLHFTNLQLLWPR